MREPPWNRCDECGKFIALDDFGDGGAVRVLVTPDSEYTSETFKTLCAKHAKRESQKDGI